MKPKHEVNRTPHRQNTKEENETNVFQLKDTAQELTKEQQALQS